MRLFVKHLIITYLILAIACVFVSWDINVISNATSNDRCGALIVGLAISAFTFFLNLSINEDDIN